jgi:DNA invertase Pin-like site-specific DNA recombinase
MIPAVCAERSDRPETGDDCEGAALARRRNASGPALPGPGGIAYLTPRQAEVLQWAARGMGYKQIAFHLGISRRTVEDLFGEMRKHTGARTRAELIACAVSAGLVQPEPGLLHSPRRPEPDRLNGTRICPENVSPRDLAEWLAPDPPQPSGTRIGYARGRAGGQSLSRQFAALSEAGCLRVFADEQAGRATAQPELAACLDYLRPGDTLIVPSLDRPSHSLSDLITLVGQLAQRGVGFTSLHERLDTTTPGGRLIFHVFAALAEFIRELIAEHTREGLQAARDGGQRLGRPPALSPGQVRHARALLTEPGNTVASIARLLQVSRSTVYKYLPEITSGEPSAGRRP